MHWYSRRDFVKNASIALAGNRTRWFQGAAEQIDLKECVLVTSQNPTPREVKALTVLSEESYKRSGLTWKLQSSKRATAPVTIYAGLASSMVGWGRGRMPQRLLSMDMSGDVRNTSRKRRHRTLDNHCRQRRTRSALWCGSTAPPDRLWPANSNHRARPAAYTQ